MWGGRGSKLWWLYLALCSEAPPGGGWKKGTLWKHITFYVIFPALFFGGGVIFFLSLFTKYMTFKNREHFNKNSAFLICVNKIWWRVMNSLFEIFFQKFWTLNRVLSYICLPELSHEPAWGTFAWALDMNESLHNFVKAQIKIIRTFLDAFLHSRRLKKRYNPFRCSLKNC